MDIVKTLKDTYGKAIDIMFHPDSSTKKSMRIGEALAFYYTLAIIPLILSIIVTMVIYIPANLFFGGATKGIMLLIMVLTYLVFTPLGLIINSEIYNLIIKGLFKMYNQGYDAVFTAFTYGAIPLILTYWLLRVPFIGMALILLSGLWGFIVEIIAISNLLSMSRLKALGTILLNSIVLVIIIYFIIFVIGLSAISLGLISPKSLSTMGTMNTNYGLTTTAQSSPSNPNPQPETNLGNATGIYQGQRVYLTIVPQRSVEAFPGVQLVGILYDFNTTNSSYSCLDGALINVWQANNEYPGYLVAHNGGEGRECKYITAIFKT
ncbi:MAG: hypothetical protein ACP5RT_03250 [Candidatus Micrarchaeia archaeon]